MEELAAIEEVAERKEKNNPAVHYVPNGKAEEFIRMVGSNKNFINLFVAANAVGKSAAGANIVANICYGTQSKWFDHQLFKEFPYLKKGRIISDPTTIKEKIIPELKKWFPKNEVERLPEANYETAKEGKAYEAKFTTKTGFEFDIMSNEQDPKEFESVDLGWVWFDEPPPEAVWKATVARGRMGMIMFGTLTPLMYSAWIKEQIIDRAEDIGADWVEAEVEDNCKIHGTRGILEHSNIERMVAAMDEDEKESRAFGKFGHLIGRVHKAFSRKIHVIKPFPIDEKRFTVYSALDPHPRVPDHVLYMAVDKNGTKYFCGELLSKGLPRDLSERMKAMETAQKYRVEDRIIDPSAYIDDQHSEKPSVGSQLDDLGIFCRRGSKDLMAGIKRMNQALDYEVKAGRFIREPEMYVFDTCPVFIKQTDEYVWDEWRGKSADDKQPKGKPKDKNDHQVENAHRLLLAEFEYVPYQMRRGASVTVSQGEEDLDPYA